MTSDCLPRQVALLESIEGAGRKRKRSTEVKIDIEPSDHHGAHSHEAALSSVEVTAGGAVMGADAEAGPSEAATGAKSPVTAPPDLKRSKLDAEVAGVGDVAGVADEAGVAALEEGAMEEAAMEEATTEEVPPLPPLPPPLPETAPVPEPAAAAEETEVEGMAVEPAAPDTAPEAAAVEPPPPPPPPPEPMVPDTAPVPMVEDDEEEGVDETDEVAVNVNVKAEPAPDAADTSMMEVRSPALDTAP